MLESPRPSEFLLQLAEFWYGLARSIRPERISVDMIYKVPHGVWCARSSPETTTILFSTMLVPRWRVFAVPCGMNARGMGHANS